MGDSFIESDEDHDKGDRSMMAVKIEAIGDYYSLADIISLHYGVRFYPAKILTCHVPLKFTFILYLFFTLLFSIN